MDKQKQIEEMAGCKDCYDNLGHCPSQDDKDICPCYKNAVENYKQGYRKIPENAVVMTREQYEKDLAIERELGERKASKARKKTAEKIAEKVHNLFNRDIKDSVVYTQEEKDILKDFVESIYEICKEITDGKV